MGSESTRESDLTAKARVMESAIATFGRVGFALGSVREIADAAGVSAGLVIHHFGSKDELRRQCDDRVVDFLREKSAGSTVGIAEVSARVGAYGPYLARMLTDGTDAGNALFDRILSETESMVERELAAGTMRKVGDARAIAMVLTAHSLAPLLLNAQLARVTGETHLSQDLLLTIARPTAEIYTRGLFSTDRLTDAVGEAQGA